MAFYYILGILTTSLVSVFAASSILSKNIEYSNPDTSATNVEDALNELYTKENQSLYEPSIFYYLNEPQDFVTKKDGYYKIELWGAQGGSNYGRQIANTGNYGGKGAYTIGTIYLKSDTKLFVYVGGAGKLSLSTIDQESSGYNGGGRGGYEPSCYENCIRGAGGGGGATDIRLDSNLYSRIMVAAGGGGVANWNSPKVGAAAGALKGFSGDYYSTGSSYYVNSTGATQITGGKGGIGSSTASSGTFGVGGNGVTLYGGGGGAGYYGGGAGSVNSSVVGSGASGSSYISGYQGCVAISSATSLTPRNDANGTQCTESSAASDITCSYHYSGYVFTNANMIAGNASMPTHDGTSTMTGNLGNGYAKITYLGTTSN